MGLFSFIKEAGEKLFGGKKVEEAAATNDTASLAQLNAEAGAAIKSYIEAQNLGLSNLNVMFDGASGKVTLTGDAPNKEAAEKATLAAGNVASVNDVDNNLNVADGGGSDAHFTGAAGIPSLDGLGLLGAGYHTLEEHIEVDSLVRRTRLLAGLLARLSG